MAQELVQQQTQSQTQTQTLAPQQLLVVRLLELPVADLESRVRDEMVANEALEQGPGENDEGQEHQDDISQTMLMQMVIMKKIPPTATTPTSRYAADQRADYASGRRHARLPAVAARYGRPL